jgi:hypothetical protein
MNEWTLNSHFAFVACINMLFLHSNTIASWESCLTENIMCNIEPFFYKWGKKHRSFTKVVSKKELHTVFFLFWTTEYSGYIDKMFDSCHAMMHVILGFYRWYFLLKFEHFCEYLIIQHPSRSGGTNYHFRQIKVYLVLPLIERPELKKCWLLCMHVGFYLFFAFIATVNNVKIK